MKGKWEQYILSQMAFILSAEDSLGQTKCMTNVQVTVRVGVRKGNDEFLSSFGGSIGFKGLALFPLLLYGNFVRTQGVTLSSSFAADLQLGHGRRRWFCTHWACVSRIRMMVMVMVMRFDTN
jgi:L-cystine uptake protein TcyP (sodium:dicarboxylate symporter family)